AMAGGDDLAPAAGGRAHDTPGCGGGRHAQTVDGIPHTRVPHAAVVDLVQLGRHEARADEHDSHAVGRQLGTEGLGEGAQGEFAHPVRPGAGGTEVAAHAADDDEAAARASEVVESGVYGAQDAEDVCRELAPVVVELQSPHLAHH